MGVKSQVKAGDESLSFLSIQLNNWDIKEVWSVICLSYGKLQRSDPRSLNPAWVSRTAFRSDLILTSVGIWCGWHVISPSLSGCSDYEVHCRPAHGFIHVLPVTENMTEFTRVIQEQRISGNMDTPEGGFDAMLQATVCQVNPPVFDCISITSHMKKYPPAQY